MIFDLGIDLGGTNTKLVLTDPRGSVVRRAMFRSEGAAGPAAWLGALEPEAFRLLDGAAPRSVGLSVAGLVDQRGRIAQAPNLVRFVGVDLQGPVSAWWPGARVRVENDVNCAVVGEHRAGAGRGCRDLCMLSLGTGVGGGLVLGGRLHRGATGLAGELGHMVLESEGHLCTCGRRGHVEAYLSTQAIVARARRFLAEALPGEGIWLREAVASGRTPEPQVLSEGADRGCELCRSVLAESGRWLGIACVNLAHALQPERILVGGGVAGAGHWLLDPAREEFEHRAMDAIRGTVPIVGAALGQDGAAIGAAMLGREALDDPAGGTHQSPRE